MLCHLGFQTRVVFLWVRVRVLLDATADIEHRILHLFFTNPLPAAIVLALWKSYGNNAAHLVNIVPAIQPQVKG